MAGAPTDVDLTVLHLRFETERSPADLEILVAHYRPLADRIAARMYRGGDIAEDLRQVAYEALVIALDRFETDRGVPFPAFAGPTIIGALKHFFRDSGWALRVPRRVHDVATAIAPAVERLTARLGGPPTPRELADELGMDVEELLEVQEAIAARATTSIEAGADDGGGGWREAMLPTDDPVLARVDRLALRQALDELTDRDREVLDLAFTEELSQSAIAERYGVSQMQVSRWVRSALNRLRDRLVV